MRERFSHDRHNSGRIGLISAKFSHCANPILSVIGTCFILIGAVMIALFGAVNEPNHSLEDLIELYKRPAFIAYFSITELVVIGLLIANKFGEYALVQMIRNERDNMFGWSLKKFHYSKVSYKRWTFIKFDQVF